MPVIKRNVNSISKAGSAQIKGDVTLTGGTNVTLTQSGQDISIASAGGAGGGDVSKVGTPLNNQVGVWTGDGTIEGDAALTYDSATDTLTSVTFAGALTGNATTATDTAAKTGTGSTYATSTAPTFATSVTGSYLTASEMLITGVSKEIISAPVATYPSLTELTYLKGVTSALQTQINAKGVGTVTAVSVATANGVSGSSSGGATPALTIALGAVTPSSVASTGAISTGANAGTIGSVKLFGNTSGDVTLTPNAIAGTGIVLTLPATTGTLVTGGGTASGTNTGDNAANTTYAIGSQTQAYNANLTAINQALTTTSSPSFTTVTAALTGTASGNVVSSVATLSSLASIGTITTGTWNATDITVANGGTGRSTSTTAYALLAAGTTATGAHQTLAAGATTEILVGAGTGALPAWTTATGSGAPVRATSPTLVTPLLGTPTSGVATNITALNATQLTTGTIPDARMPNLTGDVTTVEGAVATTLGTSVVDNVHLAIGVPVQMVAVSTTAAATGTTTIPQDDTIPQNTEGDEYMTLAITPKSTTNILIIEAVLVLGCSAAGRNTIAALFQDATAGALAASLQFNDSSSTSLPLGLTVRHTMVAGTTSATTFKIRAGAQAAATITFNGNNSARLFGAITKSSMVITEYKAA